MTNRIRELNVANYRVDPAEAELRILVRPEKLTPTTRVKGRLMGPRCAYASTVEVAYHVHEIARTDHLLLRVIIPDPCLWDPQSPFLYEGPLELWQGEERVDEVRVSHGIRHMKLNARGLRLNGHPLILQGTTAQIETEADARQLHESRRNLVIARPDADDDLLWRLADRFGYFVLAQATEPSLYLRLRSKAAARPSMLGWILPRAFLGDDDFQAGLLHGDVARRSFIGVDLSEFDRQVLPELVTFVLCEEESLAGLQELPVAKLVYVDNLEQPEREAMGSIQRTP